MNAPLDHRETAANYRAVITRKGKYRVILCRDGIQWILQRKKGRDDRPWEGFGYFTTRAALMRDWERLHGQIPPEIARLPDRARESRKGKVQ